MVPFAGFEMPVQYTSVLDEVKAVRNHAGLFDVSHMGQLSVLGPQALTQVQKLVTNDLTRISVGQAQYNMLCNEQGGVIDDIIVYRRSESQVYICVNAANRKTDILWMKSHLDTSVELIDESDETALIALQGPRSEQILEECAHCDAAKVLKYYWATETKIFGKSCYLSRTGYTGEDGFELYVSSKHARDIWQELLHIGRRLDLIPAGLGARDTLRLEMGYPLHGHEISPSISPLSAGLSWVVKTERISPFIGQEALKKEKRTGSRQILRALVVQDRRIARQGYKILDSRKKAIGTITSGTFSPHVNAPIALGFVDRMYNELDTVSVDIRGALIETKVSSLPFVEARVKKSS